MSDEPVNDELYARAPPLVRALATLLRATNRLAPLRRAGVAANRAVLHGGAWLLARQPGVRAVLVRHSALTEDFTPWVSDIDLDVVLADEHDTLATSRAVARAFARLKRGYPLFGELEVQSARELSAWQRWGGLEALEARHWLSLAGDVPRATAPTPDERLAVTNINVECFNLLFWQLYGILFSPSINGAAFVKVWAKLQQRLWCRPDDLEAQLTRSRQSVLTALREVEPAMAARLARIGRRESPCLDDDMVEALQFLFDQLLARLSVPVAGKPVALAVTMEHERPTRADVLDLLAPASNDFCGIPGLSDPVLLSGRLGDSGAIGSYNYKLYLRLAEQETPHWAARLGEVREVFNRHRRTWPFNYFGACSLPMLVPDQAFDFALESWDPIEGIEHAVRCRAPTVPSPIFVERSLAYFCNSNRHHRGFGFNSPFTDRIREDFGAELTLVDYVITLAQLRLALARDCLGVTPEDVLTLYHHHLPETAELGAELERWWRRYGNLRPRDMARALDMKRLEEEAQPLIACQKNGLFRWLAQSSEP